MKYLILIAVLILAGCSSKAYSRWTTFDAQGRITAEGVDTSLISCLIITDASDIIAASDGTKRILMVGKIVEQPDPVSGGVMNWLWAFFGLGVKP